jgi:hypothetical protein
MTLEHISSSGMLIKVISQPRAEQHAVPEYATDSRAGASTQRRKKSSPTASSKPPADTHFTRFEWNIYMARTGVRRFEIATYGGGFPPAAGVREQSADVSVRPRDRRHCGAVQ